MAKQALCDALSLDNKSINLPKLPPSNQTSSYASSADNIAKLLPNWINSSKKSSQMRSESIETTQTMSSLINQQVIPSPPSEGYDNSFQCGYNSSNLFHNNQKNSYYSNDSNSDVSQPVSPERSMFLDHESKPNIEDHMPPLSFLEKWLFDEASTQGDFMNVSLEESELDLF
ncbi:myb-related protein 306-like [Rutidosis leptorrhynchoides]|uniref:myb-related protein 306-like n=1 Tax=Rutidosis leptorrhynchoides TaxID=125765 RepID=UPI003A99C0D3